MPEPEPKPCPFCGEIKDLNSHDDPGNESMSRGESFVFCSNCGARGPVVEGEYKGGEKLWNRRASLSGEGDKWEALAREASKIMDSVGACGCSWDETGHEFEREGIMIPELEKTAICDWHKRLAALESAKGSPDPYVRMIQQQIDKGTGAQDMTPEEAEVEAKKRRN